MIPNTVSTNLRVPQTDWLQLKNYASELGISANEYINRLIKITPPSTILKANSSKNLYHQAPIWELPKLAKREKGKGFKLSVIDGTIYEA